MNYAENKIQKETIAAWLATRNFTVFGTLKFTDGHDMLDEQGEKLLRKFLNKLDRIYLGSNLINAGHRIERVVFKHTGESFNNLHYHFVARPAGDIDFFCETARCVWDEISTFTMGLENTIIDQIRNQDDVANYCLHEYWVHGADTLVLPTIHKSTPTPNINPIHQQCRLEKRISQNELTKQRASERAIISHARKLKKQKNIAKNTATY